MFKTVSDPFVGRINLFRVFSGRFRPDSTSFNATKATDERVGHLFAMQGKDHETVAEVPAGDIGAVAKLAHATTGDTFSAKSDPVTLPAIELPEPLFAVAIEPKTKGDEDKLSTAIARAREDDPTLRVERSSETHETVLYGMGEMHVATMVERMKAKFGVDVVTHPAKVPYKETLKRSAKAQGRHVKQSGGHGQYGVAWIEVEPLPRGGGFEFVDKIFGGAIPHQFIPSVEKGIVKQMTDGVLTPYQMVDVRVTLYDGKFHTVDSSDMAFQIAGSLAIKEAAAAAGVALLEPIMQVEIVVPESYMGDVIGDLNSKRGKRPGHGDDRVGQAADPRDGAAGRDDALRDRPALDDRRPRRVHDDRATTTRRSRRTWPRRSSPRRRRRSRKRARRDGRGLTRACARRPASGPCASPRTARRPPRGTARRCSAVVGEERDPEARVHAAQLLADPLLERLGQAAQRERRALAVGLGQQERELVAADAEHAVAAARALGQHRRDLPQRLVAGGVPVAVVQLLEPVEVADHQRERVPVAAASGRSRPPARG